MKPHLGRTHACQTQLFACSDERVELQGRSTRSSTRMPGEWDTTELTRTLLTIILFLLFLPSHLRLVSGLCNATSITESEKHSSHDPPVLGSNAEEISLEYNQKREEVESSGYGQAIGVKCDFTHILAAFA
jgi:hypothetical protein